MSNNNNNNNKGERDVQKEKKMLVGVAWNCAAELKFLVTALLVVCSLVTVLQFLPSHFSLISSSSSDLRDCISASLTTTPAAAVSVQDAVLPNAVATVAPSPLPLPPPPPPPTTPSPPPAAPSIQLQQDEIVEGGIIKRAFNPIGSAAYNFVLMSAYRGGLDTFAVIGLASKPLHVYGRPKYQCQWVPYDLTSNSNSSSSSPITGSAYKILPDWGYGHVYTVVVVNCTFPVPVGHDGSGGRLVLQATTNGGGDRNLNVTDTIEALKEPPLAVGAGLGGISKNKNNNMAITFTSWAAPPKYEYLYCGSPLYGNLSPQRVREWLAYHVRLFGERSHFVMHDAGGVHPEVMSVIRPWMEKGYVTMNDIRDQERFDGYYHNQFLVVNDCLHRYRFASKWIFFFDLDEFIFVPPKSTIHSLLDSLSGYSQFTIEQMPMSNNLCPSLDSPNSFRKWGFEKLVYKDVKRGIRRDRKYAVQPRNVFATGVHMSQNIQGKTTHKTEGRIRYFHYHGTIAERREPCRQLINETAITVDGIPYVMDTTLRDVAGSVKRFELKMIGSRLRRTRQ